MRGPRSAAKRGKRRRTDRDGTAVVSGEGGAWRRIEMLDATRWIIGRIHFVAFAFDGDTLRIARAPAP